MKGLAILFMLLVHCHEMFGVYPFEPTGAVYLRTGDPAQLEDAFHYLFAVDILAFAGLTFLFFAGGAKLPFRAAHFIAAALVCTAANLMLSGITVTSPAVYRVTDLIWGTSEYTWFPFLTWIPFPIGGYLFGQLLLRCRDKRSFYRSCLWVSVPALVTLGLFTVENGVDYGWADGFWESPYFHHNLMGNLVLLSFVVTWISAFFFLALLLPGFARTALCRWSKNITEMFCIHWLIVSFTWVLYPDPFPLSWVLAYFVVLVPVTDWAASRYLAVIAKRSTPRPARGAAA